jgi:AcrR family transcriptional regulator
MNHWEPDAAGCLVKPALVLFDQQGYSDTTVAEIARRAGLATRSSPRYFAEEGEVLVSGTEQLERAWVDAMAAAPEEADPLLVARAGLDAVAGLFLERHVLAHLRARAVTASPELCGAQLMKLERLTAPAAAARRAEETGVRIFHVEFGGWVGQADPPALSQLTTRGFENLLAGCDGEPGSSPGGKLPLNCRIENAVQL